MVDQTVIRLESTTELNTPTSRNKINGSMALKGERTERQLGPSRVAGHPITYKRNRMIQSGKTVTVQSEEPKPTWRFTADIQGVFNIR